MEVANYLLTGMTLQVEDLAIESERVGGEIWWLSKKLCFFLHFSHLYLGEDVQVSLVSWTRMLIFTQGPRSNLMNISW